MSTTTLDVELDLEAIKKENEEKHKLANEKLTSLKKDLEDAQKIIQDSPEQIEKLMKKQKDALPILTELENKFKFLEEDDPTYPQTEKELNVAKEAKKFTDLQLQDIKQKFEQAKLDEIRLKKEIEAQQHDIQILKRKMDENKNPQSESSQSPHLKSFGSTHGTTKSNNKEIFEEKKKEAFKQLKALCNKPNTKYSYDDKNQEVTLKGKGGIINFTKNGASTNSDKDEDVYAMARDLFDAYIKDENDLKKVKFNPSGPKEETLKKAIAELKAAKLKEFQDAKLKKPESHLNVDEDSTRRFTNSSFSRS